MPSRYYRSVCSAELRLRREILEKSESKTGDPQIRSKFHGSKRPNKAENSDINDESSPITSTSVTSAASFLKEEVNIADLSDVIIDEDGSKGYV